MSFIYSSPLNLCKNGMHLLQLVKMHKEPLLSLFLWPLVSLEAEVLTGVLSLMEAEALTTL